MKTATFAAAFLGILALAPTTASAIPIWGNDTPIVIALDGINPTENTPIVNLFTTPHDKEYLAPALRKVWPLSQLPSASLQTTYWQGNLSKTTLLIDYKNHARTLIENQATANPNKKIVVISQSWGSVVAFQALNELANVLPANRISTWLTLGSPLEGNLAIKEAVAAYPGVVYGSDYVKAGDLVKPKVVQHWNNRYAPINQDVVSGPKGSAVNVLEQYAPNDGRPLPFGLEAHNFYFTPQIVPLLAETIVSNFYDYNCQNSYILPYPQSVQYASPANFFSPEQELVVRSACTPSVILPTVGNGSDKQFIWQDGYYVLNGQWIRFSFTGGLRDSDPAWIGFFKGPRRRLCRRISSLKGPTTSWLIFALS